MKLVAFSKLGVSPSTSGLSGESAPLINSDDMFDTMSMELQQLLIKVRRVITYFIMLKILHVYLFLEGGP